MINLKKFFESPFKSLKVGKDKLFKFFEDHKNRLEQAVADGEPFAAILSATITVFNNLKLSLGIQSGILAQKQAKTKTVDAIIKEFKTIIRLRYANILVKFPKKSDTYKEFFPHGLSEYTKASKASIERLMTQLIMALHDYKTELGDALLDEFVALQTAYVTAREAQLKKKKEVNSKGDNWELYLEVMQKQSFINLLTIALTYPDEPEKAKEFFDESIVKPHHYDKEGNVIEPYSLTVAATKTAVANISFSVDDKLFIAVIGDASVFYYGAKTEDALCPATATEILPGESADVTGAMLGAPANKYLLFTNKDTTQETEVEITLLVD